MNTKRKKVALVLMIFLVFPSNLLLKIRGVYSESNDGSIDLFTQKKPYSGEGKNMPSDAFTFGEEVIIYASVTYREYPIQSVPVAFKVMGPNNPTKNITFCRTAITNETGTSLIWFRISLLNESTYGDWKVIGNTKIGDTIFQDSVSFKVGWIVELTSLNTVDENQIHKGIFVRGSHVGIAVTLVNIGMTERRITLALALFDQLNILLNSTEINNLIIPPDETPFKVCFFLRIPKSAHAGEAVVRAGVYTSSVNTNGVPYCPEKSKSFFITNINLKISDIHIHPTTVYVGEDVHIEVTVRNEGWEIESSNVSVYYNKTHIDTSHIVDLHPRSDVITSFIWDTGHIEEGLYQISAQVEPVPGEMYISDNTLIDGVVRVKVKTTPPYRVHDVAVLDVTPSSNTVCIGGTLSIDVTVKNEGSYYESFNVAVYYSSPGILVGDVVGAMSVDLLAPNTTKTLIFQWNTEGVAEGNYTLNAWAENVEKEEDIEDNSFEDGVVEVKAGAAGWFVPSWFWRLLLFLLVLLLILLIVWAYRRRKRKAVEETFHSGWTAWYYCYDPRNKFSGTNSSAHH